MDSISESLKWWLEDNLIQYKNLDNRRILIDGKKMIEFIPDNNVISTVDKGLCLTLSVNETNQILDGKVDYVIYEFGDDYFYTPASHIIDVQLEPLKYLGKADQSFIPKNETNRAFLGVHGRYEAMSGTRDYSDWCEKAKFLGIQSLGICESQTLGGTLPFQLACKKKGIKPIIGYTCLYEYDGNRHEIKLFAINDIGWQSLLRLNNKVNVDIEGFIQYKDLLKVLGKDNGLCAVICPGKHVTEKTINDIVSRCDKVFYQITSNEYMSGAKDLEILNSMKKYFDEYYSLIDPILISDAYCLDVRDVHIKTALSKTSKFNFSNATANHYFRSFDEVFVELEDLFNQDDDRLEKFFLAGVKNIGWIVENCKFEIETNKLFLPEYEMTEDQKQKFISNEDLFDHLIRKGIGVRYAPQMSRSTEFVKQVESRIKEEIRVIKKGGFVDYFLILWDIVNWCKTQNIQIGPGRGSAAGCVVSYALGIVKIDPFQFNLIFERFLNEARIESELPDIDLDFASDRRDNVIQYMRDRYGENYVCRVGTYGTLQMRGVIQELSRIHGVKGDYNLNFITRLIEGDNEKWEPLFSDAAESTLLKQFIRDNPQLIHDAKLALNSVKSHAMHACATIIVPKLRKNDSELNLYNQIPIRKDDKAGVIVSEWEGDIMAEAGYLKEDILSTRQMAKIGHMIDSIQERTGERIDTETIKLDDPNVFHLFQQGRNQDVFHFGSKGLTAYLKEVQPEHIEELIASIALYRPGAMASNAHIDYIRLKSGKIEPKYDYMLESVTKDTYSLYAYQEQIMQAVQVLGGFTLSEADGVRKAMGKKIQSKMDGYKVQFIESAVSKGCDENEAAAIWNKMEVFAGYGFNKSHAAAYSVIGYYCNWFKYYYPIDFWTVALQFAKDDKIQDFVSEIKRSGMIEIVAPDINESDFEFRADFDLNKIYWNLGQISQVANVSSTAIIEERSANGKFFSIEEFTERVPSRSVNKRVIEHLILSGCFDSMYDVRKASDRFKIMKKYYDTRPKDDLPQVYLDNLSADHYWSIRQDEVSKISNLDYSTLIKKSNLAIYSSYYIDSESFNQDLQDETKEAMIIGTISEIILRKTKKGDEFAVIRLIQDEYQMQVRVWPSELSNVKKDARLNDLCHIIKEDIHALIMVRGLLSYSKYIKGNEMVVNPRLKGDLFQSFLT